jgi:hypothetical protein
MDQANRNIVKMVANLVPYFAPLPSAYFVSRSGIKHLDLPILMGLIIGVVIETLGFSSVHTWLWLSDWNIRRKKTDTKAPEQYALILVVMYLIVTICLTVVLEVVPNLAVFAPAMFPFLAVTGAVDLVLISQQEQREIEAQFVHKERSEKRRGMTHSNVQDEDHKTSNLATSNTSLDIANAARKRNKANILDTIQTILDEHPDTGVTELARCTGVKSRTTIYSYIKELQALGRINSNSNSINS